MCLLKPACNCLAFCTSAIVYMLLNVLICYSDCVLRLTVFIYVWWDIHVFLNLRWRVYTTVPFSSFLYSAMGLLSDMEHIVPCDVITNENGEKARQTDASCQMPCAAVAFSRAASQPGSFPPLAEPAIILNGQNG